MFHHVALYRLKSGVTLDRVRQARESLAALAEQMPGLLHFGVVENLVSEPRGYTLALVAVFESEKAFEIFRRHPVVEKALVRELAPVVEGSLTAQG